MKRGRAIIIKLVIFVLLVSGGAVVNVGVAATIVRLQGSVASVEYGRTWARVVWSSAEGAGQEMRDAYLGVTHWGQEEPYRMTYSVGLPFHALAARTQLVDGEARSDPAIALAPRVPYGMPPELPLRPIFPGFLINTLLYTLVLWLLWSAPFATRRLIRKRRGRCVKCGYDLSGIEHDVCPECGSGR